MNIESAEQNVNTEVHKEITHDAFDGYQVLSGVMDSAIISLRNSVLNQQHVLALDEIHKRWKEVSAAVSDVIMPSIDQANKTAKNAVMNFGQLIPHETIKALAEFKDIKVDPLFKKMFFYTCVERSCDSVQQIAIARAHRNISLYQSPDPNDLHHEIAKKCLNNWGEENNCPNLGENSEIRRQLAGKIADHVNAFVDQCLKWLNDHIPNYNDASRFQEGKELPLPLPLFIEDGLLWIDLVFINYLEGIGESGSKTAKELHLKSKEWHTLYTESGDPIDLLRFWCDFRKGGEGRLSLLAHSDTSHPCTSHFDLILAEIIWVDQLFPQWEKAERLRPALALTVSDQLSKVCFERDRKVISNKDKIQVISYDKKVIADVATINPNTIANLQAQLNSLGTLAAQRLIRFLIEKAHEQFKSDVPDPTTIRITGGIESLSCLIGETSKKSQSIIPSILEAGQHFCMRWSGGAIGGLWTYYYSDQRGRGRSAVVEIHLNPSLAPHYIHNIKKLGRSDILVPILPLPSFVNPKKYYSQQAAFQQCGIVRALVAGRKQIHKYGGVHLTKDDFVDIGARVGLPKPVALRAIDDWTQDGDDSERMLEIVDKDRYHLANNSTFGPARRFIDRTSELSATKRKNYEKRFN